MPIDWDGLVLTPCMDIFALDGRNGPGPVLTPLKSQPNVPAFGIRAVWEVTPTTITQEDGSLMTTTIYTLGIRLREFPVPPVKGDMITIDNEDYILNDFQYDGQGGVRWIVKGKKPSQETHYAQSV